MTRQGGATPPTGCLDQRAATLHCASAGPAGSTAPPHKDHPEHRQDAVAALQSDLPEAQQRAHDCIEHQRALQSDLQEAHQRAALHHKAMVQMKEK